MIVVDASVLLPALADGRDARTGQTRLLLSDECRRRRGSRLAFDTDDEQAHGLRLLLLAGKQA